MSQTDRYGLDMEKPPAQERAERLVFIAVILAIAGGVTMAFGSSGEDDAVVFALLGYIALAVAGGVLLVGVIALGVQMGMTAVAEQQAADRDTGV